MYPSKKSICLYSTFDCHTHFIWTRLFCTIHSFKSTYYFKSFTFLYFFIALFSACTPKPSASPSFVITSVDPNPVLVGETIEIHGRGFGTEEGWVSMSARPLTLISWSSDLIMAQIPSDTPRGETVLVVSTTEEQSPPFPVSVQGDVGQRPAQSFQPSSDFSMPPVTLNDFTTPSDMNPITDQGMQSSIRVTLDQPDATVTMRAIRGDTSNGGNPDELCIIIDSKLNAWGIASHLKYDHQKLTFLRMVEPANPNRQARVSDLADQRIFWYTIEEQNAQLLTLCFRINNPNQTQNLAFSFVPRFSALRDRTNQSLAATWSNAIITVEGTRNDGP